MLSYTLVGESSVPKNSPGLTFGAFSSYIGIADVSVSIEESESTFSIT